MALKGIRVIEMAGLAPSPFCGRILSDFGADVIRVDRVRGLYKPSNLEAFEPKWVNPDDIWYGVNSLRLGGLHLFHVLKIFYYQLITNSH